MPKYKITRAEFYKDKWVMYFSIADGNCYASMHDRTGLSDEQAKGVFDKKEGYLHGKFRREHFRQVDEQLAKNRTKERIILN